MPVRILRSALCTAVFAVCAVPGAGASASALPDYPFIHVSGSAMRYGMPDTAALDFEVVAADADPAAARAVLEARVQEVRALAQQLGIADDDVTVQDVKQNLRKAEAGSSTPVTEVRCYVDIKVKDVSKWPALASAVFGKPNLNNFASTFDTAALSGVEAELMTQAIADARRHADMMAEGFGARVSTVMGATPGSLRVLGRVMGLDADELRGARAGSAVRGQSTGERPAGDQPVLVVPLMRWQQAVDVVFRIEPVGGAKRKK